MAKTDDRFIRVYTQGAVNVSEIWVDKQTGVNYLFVQNGYGRGLTPLLNRDGSVVVTPTSQLKAE